MAPYAQGPKLLLPQPQGPAAMHQTGQTAASKRQGKVILASWLDGTDLASLESACSTLDRASIIKTNKILLQEICFHSKAFTKIEVWVGTFWIAQNRFLGQHHTCIAQNTSLGQHHTCSCLRCWRRSSSHCAPAERHRAMKLNDGRKTACGI